MTSRTITRIAMGAALPLLLVSSVPQHAHAEMKLSVASVTMVKAPPTCEVRSTKKRMTSGNVTEIVWKSEYATRMTGLVKGEQVWPAKGRQRVAIAVVGKHEFPLTFEGPGGTATCIAKVFVKPRK